MLNTYLLPIINQQNRTEVLCKMIKNKFYKIYMYLTYNIHLTYK